MSIAAQAIHGARVCVIPDPDNDFRPLALRHRPLALVSMLLLTAKLIAATTIALLPQTADLSTITSSRIVELTNVERKQAGASTLKVSSLLTNAAQQKAQHMLDEDYFAHISPSGVTPWFWMAKVGYAYEMAGENLAIDFIEAEDVVAAWLASPSHRDNMLQAGYTETGVAVATGEFQDGTSTVVVHMFGKPPGATAQPSPVGKSAGTKTTPTPNPIPSPTPSPTPVPAPKDTTPPRVPRIAIVGEVLTVKDSVEITVSGEATSRVTILMNNQARQTLILPESGTDNLTLALGSFPDGPLILRASAADAAGNRSELSEAVRLAKDTLGPVIAENSLVFALSPAFDRAQVALRVPEDVRVAGKTAGWVALGEANEEISLALEDELGNETKLANLRLTPQLAQDANLEELAIPAQAQTLARRVAAVVAASLLLLLSLAVVIHIRVQRPGLIAHTGAVILLALALWIA